MTTRRRGPLVLAGLLAVLVATGGAAVNLRLMGSREPTADPLALAIVRPGTTAGPADDPGGGPPATEVPPPAPDPNAPSTSTLPSTAAPPRDPSPDPAPTPVPPPPPAATTTSYVVGAAGTVTLAVQGATISVISVRPASGWTSSREQPSDDEVELSFRRGSDGAETSLHGQIENGRLRVEIEDERAEPPDD